MANSFPLSFFDRQSLQYRANREYDRLCPFAKQLLALFPIYPNSPGNVQLFIQLWFQQVMCAIKSPQVIINEVIFKEVEEYRAGNSSAFLSKINLRIAFLEQQLGTGQPPALRNDHELQSQHTPSAPKQGTHGAFASSSDFEINDSYLYSAQSIVVHQYSRSPSSTFRETDSKEYASLRRHSI
ncbi:hypothetical protein BDP27DRAFT_1403886 [Rhodocollybia butyracea]|uniref:Uncharacterized protein n=1 Tax=Rhodocollybia butyracea TaxID=206335 RepID=A0A9P5U5T4_9AGAR|nr:hypothetical protein BDP27DRAFT_1403886 [Rhodocollybia butyracea]